MKTIPLSRGLFALVDDCDFDFLNRWKWYAWTNGKIFYAVRAGKLRHVSMKLIHMHQVILGFLSCFEIDHKDADGLNNQRSNLRLATRSQNGANRRKTLDATTSRFKGVSWRKDENCWRARIMFQGRPISLGSYKDEVEARLAYNRAALKLFGQYARSNAV